MSPIKWEYICLYSMDYAELAMAWDYAVDCGLAFKEYPEANFIFEPHLYSVLCSEKFVFIPSYYGWVSLTTAPLWYIGGGRIIYYNTLKSSATWG